MIGCYIGFYSDFQTKDGPEMGFQLVWDGLTYVFTESFLFLLVGPWLCVTWTGDKKWFCIEKEGRQFENGSILTGDKKLYSKTTVSTVPQQMIQTILFCGTVCLK